MSESEMPHIDTSTEDDLAQSIQTMFQVQLGITQIGQDTDFFTAGADSLQVIEAVRLLRGGLRSLTSAIHTDTITTKVIYGNSTPRRLARYIIRSLVSEDGYEGDTEDLNEIDAMKALKEKYSQGFIAAKSRRPEASEQGQTVILTGSTGTLGSYLLHQLVNSDRVKTVICLNRADDGGLKKQAITMTERGLSTNYIDKIQFYRYDLSQPGLGLPPHVYAQLLEETDRIIHNAWPVNFNITVETFEPHIRGVRNLADFAAKSKKRIAVAFVSSVSTVSGWDETLGPVPEETIKDMTLPRLGYGRSKMIGSLILEDAAKVGDFDSVIIRVSQIAGPEAAKGVWNPQEWLPSLIASSLYLKALPYNLGTLNRVDWTPVETISKLILEVTGITQSINPAELSGYFHASNPHQSTFEELAPVIQQYYGKDRILELVSFSEWVRRLENTQGQEDESVDRNPGVKLLDTYRDASASNGTKRRPIQLDMTRTLQRSLAIREAKAVSPELMRHWLKQWSFH
ncbi:nonribosomal peptide synthetase [Colletotrichum tofieldiae]|nr:nonribosomal peptide synthetase [Colletotrichum tofieldiae]